TKNCLTVRPMIEGGDVLAPLSERVLGRTAGEDIIDPVSGDKLAKRGVLIDEALAEKIDDIELESLLIRSALTCETKVGVCGACYGRDLARGTPVNMGEAVGIIAAQSIGEPGTQL
ncbi:MAG: hypothetical protein ACKVH1_13775, partial [Alphaproteobacteria bacterium]